ncbi:Tropinesterase [Burkholderiales bacterium]|nr:Tropinesterase [Burkholderiales bacterium]
MRLAVDGREVYAYTGTRPVDPAKPAVVFAHGAANDHSVWLLQSRYFAHHGRTVLALDLPGHGRSAGPALASVEAIADWLAAVLDAAGLPQASLVGHSMGALAALSCAARHPAKVTKIALLGPAAPMEVSDALLAAARANDHVAYELINEWSTSAGKRIGGNTVPGMWILGTAMRLMERTAPGVLHTDLAACHAWGGGLDAARAVRCPSLLVVGARDVMAPPRAARALAETLPGARVVTLPDTGHAMMAEQPDAVLDALRGFL